MYVFLYMIVLQYMYMIRIRAISLHGSIVFKVGIISLVWWGRGMREELGLYGSVRFPQNTIESSHDL